MGDIRCRIKEGWDQAGREGEFLGAIECNGVLWATVNWNEEEEPDLQKALSLEINCFGKWMSFDQYAELNLLDR